VVENLKRKANWKIAAKQKQAANLRKLFKIKPDGFC